MGFISPKGKEYGKYTDKQGTTHYGLIGIHDTDTELTEFFNLHSKKREVRYIDHIEIVVDEKEKRTIEVLYGNDS